MSASSSNGCKQDLAIKFRRSDAEYEIMMEQLTAYLTTCAELLEYCLYLRSFPALAAGLLAENVDEHARSRILQEAKKEWAAVKALELSSAGQQLLRQSVMHTGFQNYREVMLTMEESSFAWTETVARSCSSMAASF